MFGLLTLLVQGYIYLLFTLKKSHQQQSCSNSFKNRQDESDEHRDTKKYFIKLLTGSIFGEEHYVFCSLPHTTFPTW